MEGTDLLDAQCRNAVRILDSALGMRACGIVVSGHGTPRFSCEESPFRLTMRSLVAPVMPILGYEPPRYDSNATECPGSTVMAFVPMNRPMDDAIRQTLMVMRSDRIPRGISTDGFVWILSEMGSYGPRVRMVSDLRPYYVEALDESRFGIAMPIDRGAAEEFLMMFKRSGENRGAR